MHIVSQSHPSRDRGNKIPLSKLRGNNHLALLHVSKVLKALSLPKVRFYRSLKKERPMAKVVVSLKIFPSDVNIKLDALKRKIEKTLPKYASVYKFAEEPIAYGLTALIAHIVVPEEKSGGLDEVERLLRGITEISEMETLLVRRV